MQMNSGLKYCKDSILVHLFDTRLQSVPLTQRKKPCCNVIRTINKSRKAAPSSIDNENLTTRRNLIQNACVLPYLLFSPGLCKAQGEGAPNEHSVTTEGLIAIKTFWNESVQNIRGQIGDGFSARLVVYGVSGEVLPSRAPGDPSKDYASSGKGGDGHCGVFQPASESPYEICPAPGEPPADPTLRDCCRHYAYCIPYSRLGLGESAQSTVVVSARLLRLPAVRREAILVHELGHAVDFYLFGARYGLRSQEYIVKTRDGPLRALLEAANAEQDVETRGDILGESLLLLGRGKKLCYDPALRLQLLVDEVTQCDGNEGDSGLSRHYSHPVIPLQR